MGAARSIRDKEKNEVDLLVVRDAVPWFLVEAKRSGGVPLSDSLVRYRRKLGVSLALQVAEKLDFVERSCWRLGREMIVPARTFLSQLV